MSPEERQRWEARLREGGGRGGRNGARDGSQGGNAAARSGNSSRPSTAIAESNATTIDALFAPLRPTEGRGRLWLFANKQLRSVNVRTGISDGTWTEILEGADASELQPGTEVVTNLVTGLETQPRPGQQGPANSPLMPQRGNQRGGGPGGGGRGR
jgi:hypothetical protein